MCHSVVPEQILTHTIPNMGVVHKSYLGQERKGEAIMNEGMAKKQYEHKIFDAFYELKLKANYP